MTTRPRHSAPKLPAAAAAVMLAVTLLAACGPETWGEAPYVAHGEASDFVPVADDKADGVSAVFDADSLMSDSFFTDVSSVGADEVQAFLENAPYQGGIRCWLADHRVNGQRAAEAIVEASRQEGVNPIVMLARLQVERSAISQTATPSPHAVDFAFGCGCPDGSECNEAYRGLDRQIACAATNLRRHFDGSASGAGAWRAGQPRETLDPVTVTPANHATAALYAYTPWVLVGRGGNWLVWNVTKKFENAFADLGVVGPADPSATDPSPGDFGSCAVAGAEGRCVSIDDCSPVTHTTTPGFCPGTDSSVQCCTPLSDGPRACGDDGAEGATGNDVPANAAPLRDFLDRELTICEDDNDYFHVDLVPGGRITFAVRFSAPGLDVDAIVEHPNGDILVRGTSSGQDEVLTLDPVPVAGRYYLHLWSFGGSGSYRLELP